MADQNATVHSELRNEDDLGNRERTDPPGTQPAIRYWRRRVWRGKRELSAFHGTVWTTDKDCPIMDLLAAKITAHR